MRAPLSWLADFVNIEMPVDELAYRLTMSGLKVEAIHRTGGDWQDVYVGQVLAIEPHPRSTKPLWVSTVDLAGRRITVVTGAQNVRVGDLVPVVLVGGLLPHGPDGNPLRIERRPMAGIDSEGMLASQRELGLSDEHTGIHILPGDFALGANLRDVMGGDVLEIETNPNRPDTLSIIGIAREVAALSQQQLTLPNLDIVDNNVIWLDEESISIEVNAPDLCPRYSALRIEGVHDTSSPFWISDRLMAAGMRPISLLVDLTNYVMLEYGQPMHAFDAIRLRGDRIVVRRAHEAEQITTLDGAVRTLTPDNLVISDGDRAVAIAGIMGGENSEIASDTGTLVLESANFDPVSVRRTAQSLSLRTEASSRFEKGLPAEQTVLALRRYLQLLTQITGVQLRVARMSDAWIGASAPRIVRMPLRDLRRLIGMPVAVEAAVEALSDLGYGVRVEEEQIVAEVPYWRRTDTELSADLVEEVARLIGFETIPTTLPHLTMPATPLPTDMQREAAIRERLLASGVNECTTHSLTSPEFLTRLLKPGRSALEPDAELWAELVANPAGIRARQALTQPVRLTNPATRDRQMLRLSILPSVLDVVARNVKQTSERLAFFELGRTFFQRVGGAELPYERRTLAVAVTGHRQPAGWQDPDQGPSPYTFFDLKGLLEGCLEALHISNWRVEPISHPALHAGRAAAVLIEGQSAGHFGELHPEVAAQFDLNGFRVLIAELDLDTLFEYVSDDHIYRPLARFPVALRDLAVVLNSDISAGSVLELVRVAGGDLLESARIFDVYEGHPLPAARKSIAIGVTLRAPDATLTQEDVSSKMNEIVEALQQSLGAVLRE